MEPPRAEEPDRHERDMQGSLPVERWALVVDAARPLATMTSAGRCPGQNNGLCKSAPLAITVLRSEPAPGPCFGLAVP